MASKYKPPPGPTRTNQTMTSGRPGVAPRSREIKAANNPARRTNGTQTSRIEIHGGETGNAQYGTARELNTNGRGRSRPFNLQGAAKNRLRSKR